MGNEIDTAIHGLEQQIAVREAEIIKLREAVNTLRGVTTDVTPMAVPREGEYRGLGIVDAAKRWLQETGTSAPTRAIADTLRQRGVETKSKNFTATVYAVLTASPEFRRNKGGEWELVK